jgi:hypothetical protein
MKKFLTIASIMLFMSGFYCAQSQNPQTKLKQDELLKQFEGNWVFEIGKDTIAYWDMEPWGTGFEASLKYVTKGKIVKEGKGLYGYDSSIDKIVEAGITKGKDIGVYVMWFITESKFVLIPYNDLANPEKASFRMEGEFREPDVLVETDITENKVVKIKTWKNSKRF